jgi:hypothetical protein
MEVDIIRQVGSKTYLVLVNKRNLCFVRNSRLKKALVQKYNKRENIDIPPGHVRHWYRKPFQLATVIERCGVPKVTGLNISRTTIFRCLSCFYPTDKEASVRWFRVKTCNTIELFPEMDIACDLIQEWESKMKESEMKESEEMNFPKFDVSKSSVPDIFVLGKWEELEVSILNTAEKKSSKADKESFEDSRNNISEDTSDVVIIKTNFVTPSLVQDSKKKRKRVDAFASFFKKPKVIEPELNQTNQSTYYIEQYTKQMGEFNKSLQHLKQTQEIEIPYIAFSREDLSPSMVCLSSSPEIWQTHIGSRQDKECYVEKTNTEKITAREEVLNAFYYSSIQPSSVGSSFFFLEGPRCQTLQSIRRKWVSFPHVIDIANNVSSTCQTIFSFAREQKLTGTSVHYMKDLQFFQQFPDRKYSGIWLDRCSSNPLNKHEWEEILSLIFDQHHLGNLGTLAVTFCIRSRCKNSHEKQKYVGISTMQACLSFALKRQREIRKRWNQQHFVYKYCMIDEGSRSYASMCTMWWTFELKVQSQ